MNTQIRKYYEGIDSGFGGVNMTPCGSSKDELAERFKPYTYQRYPQDAERCATIAREYAEETVVAFLRWRELGYWHYFPTEDVYYHGKDPSLGPYTPSELYTIFDNERKQQK